MAAAPIPPPDDSSITFIHWFVGAVSGFIGAVLAAIGVSWRGGAWTTSVKKDVKTMYDRIGAVEVKVEERHNENQARLGRIEVAHAMLPTRHELERLEDRIVRRLDDWGKSFQSTIESIRDTK